jgi:tetratricopeptide (TPR) repeat protein
MDISFVGGGDDAMVIQRLPFLVNLKRQKKWPELLEACLSLAGSGGAPVAKLYACSLFYCGRYEECLSVLVANKDPSWLGRLQVCAVQLDLARTSKSPNNVACLRSICAALKQLVAEAPTDDDLELGSFNLALCLLALNDCVEACSVLEGVAKTALLQCRVQKRRKSDERSGEEIFLSPSLKLARDVCLLETLSCNVRSLLAVCYFMAGERDASEVLFQSCGDLNDAFADFRMLMDCSTIKSANVPPVVWARKLFAERQFDACIVSLKGIDSLDALELHGCCCIQLGQADEAVLLFKKCCSLSALLKLVRPKLFLNLLAAMSMAGSGLDEQLRVLSSALSILTSSASQAEVISLKIRQAGIFWKLSRFAEAAAVLDQVRSMDEVAAKQMVEMHVSALMKVSRFSDALDLLPAGNVKTIQAFGQRMECLFRLGRLAELLERAETWVDRISDSLLLCNLALAFLSHGNFAKLSVVLAVSVSLLLLLFKPVLFVG